MPVAAQKSTAGSIGSSGIGTTGTSGSLGTTTGIGTTNRNTTTNQGTMDQTRPVFLSGSVLFDDGTPPNTDVRIERVCNGNPRLESHSDSRGHFYFQVGGSGNTEMSATDAAYSGGGFGTSNANRGLSGSGLPGSSGSGGFGSTGSSSLMGCELRAAYPGYVSEMVELGNRRSLDDPEVGTIVLHRLAGVKGTTISMTTAMAPKQAQKNYQKAMQLLQKGKFEEAEGKLQDATTEYPKFALAWFELGQIQQRLNKPDDATKDYLAAIAADAKYVSPYDKLARMNADQGNWADAAKFSQQAIELNPVEFPTSFWYNAISNYQLKNFTEAEKSARSLVKLDRAHRYPEAERLLAELAASRGDLAEASAHLRAFLEEAPNGKNADQSKKDLARIEEARAAQAKNVGTPPGTPAGALAVVPPPQP